MSYSAMNGCVRLSERMHPNLFMMLFILEEGGRLVVATEESRQPETGDKVLFLAEPET